METITFYSYKGGVGRTLALANIASYLSKFGQKVCIIDFDLEAPGVHYKFPKITKKVNEGLVDYIYEFTNTKNVPNTLSDYILTIEPELSSQGTIDIIPAGNILTPDYWKKLALIDWHELFYKDNSEGILFFLELKEKIISELNPDFLLIDSRTGVTEMSSLATSILPDKVIFLSANNNENIEGASQIIRGMRNTDRFSFQKPLDIVFALTRIPETNGVREKKIVNKTLDYLNSQYPELQSKYLFKEEDICILHSDREIELSETLRLNEQGLDNDTPLLKDYLKLFSKAIPERIINERINNILYEITSGDNLLEDPDKAQNDLEYLIEVFPHRISLEKLIDFYILRNENFEKIINVFHKLWDYFGFNNPKIYIKYKNAFVKNENTRWANPKFNPEIIERYLLLDYEDKFLVEQKLASLYVGLDKTNKALEHYNILLKNGILNNELLNELLDLHIQNRNFEDANKIINDYSQLIDHDINLQLKKIHVFFLLGNKEKVESMLNQEVLHEALFKYNSRLYLRIMEEFPSLFSANRIEKITKTAIRHYDLPVLEDIRMLYSRIGKSDEFNEFILQIPNGKQILNQISRKSRRK